MDQNQLNRHEKLRLKQEELNKQREQALQGKQERSNRQKKILFWSVGSALGLILLFIGVGFAMPGHLDGFAQCLKEKNAILYGAIEWCHYTQEQAGMFGKSFKYLDYRDYRDAPIEIKKTPTWLINGQAYENVQSLERLSAITGCPLD
ncbi:MAG TPA: hypothetical protein VLJ21_02505 [Candidatus Binatia bacterium]|nr:hypothetical protein [Candidatus Binatia bacterium]